MTAILEPTKGSAVHAQSAATEAFPALHEPLIPQQSATLVTGGNPTAVQDQGRSTSSTIHGRIRSVSKNFQESSPPTGMWVATGQLASSVPSISDVRRGSFGGEGWSVQGQVVERERRASLSRHESTRSKPRSPGKDSRAQSPIAEIELHPRSLLEANGERASLTAKQQKPPFVDGSVIPDNAISSSNKAASDEATTGKRSSYDGHADQARPIIAADVARTTPFDNGYRFPPKHTWTEATLIFSTAFWKFFITPLGFLVTIYGLNIVAWGGMLFLLLCNAAPAMCRPTCNDINSPRRIWIEIDSQILNALFCVTGFGTIPWRFRDLYYILQYRIRTNELALRRLAGINSGWFRLAGSQKVPVRIDSSNVELEAGNIQTGSLPFPLSKMANAPLTGIRAPPTAIWKLDFVIWSMVWNTFFQAVLSGFMWGMNRYERPSWSTGLFVALACLVAACGGAMGFVEGKKVKSIEGVPVSEKDQNRLKRDQEQGIVHYNNIKDEKPKEKRLDPRKA